MVHCLSSQYWWRCGSHCRLYTGLFAFHNTNCSNSSLSLMRVRWLFIVRPAHLKTRSHTALAGSDVFRWINSVFSCCHAAVLAVSSPVVRMSSWSSLFNRLSECLSFNAEVIDFHAAVGHSIASGQILDTEHVIVCVDSSVTNCMAASTVVVINS